jgi:hypothetical protein
MDLQWQVREYEPMVFHVRREKQDSLSCSVPTPVMVDQRRLRLGQP